MILRRSVLLAAVTFLIFGVPALAGPISINQWYEFSFGAAGVPAAGCAGCVPSSGGNSVFASGPPWTIDVTEPGAYFVITDAFSKGDSFSVYDGLTLILTTPPVAAVGSCGSDPAICFGQAGVSYGQVSLPLGLHEFSIVPVNSPFSGGAAYFAVQPVPEPGTLLLLSAGLVALGSLRRRQI